jgi:superfamily II DNA or RNA helicase
LRRRGRRSRGWRPPARPLWPHQEKALAAFEDGRNRRAAATYLVVPPGGGKTLIGLEAARRLGRNLWR